MRPGLGEGKGVTPKTGAAGAREGRWGGEAEESSFFSNFKKKDKENLCGNGTERRDGAA